MLVHHLSVAERPSQPFGTQAAVVSGRNIGWAVVVCGLVAALGAAAGCAPKVPLDMSTDGHTVTVEDIAERDELIAAQEQMLSRLRCQFDFETEVIPGGCADGIPVLAPSEPPGFAGVPTQHDVAVREDLIRIQESLLNRLRCQFGVDTHAVPGGCRVEPGPSGVYAGAVNSTRVT